MAYIEMADLGQSAGDIALFRQFNKLAKDAKVRGDLASAVTFYAQAQAAFDRMGSPSGYKDELEFTRGVVYGEQGAQESYQRSGAMLATAKAAGPELPTFTEVAQQTGFVGALFYPWYALELDLGVPGRPLASATEQTAAEMRASGIGPLVRAAAVQSGRDASTKPKFSTGLPVSTILVGTLVGAGGGWVLGGNGGAGIGAVLGAITGYIGGDLAQKAYASAASAAVRA